MRARLSFRLRRGRLLAALLSLLSSAGCASSEPLFVDVRVFDVAGDDPIEARGFDALRVRILQEGFALRDESIPLTGALNQGVYFDSLTAATRIALSLSRDGDVLWTGSTPRFVPAETGGRVEIVVGPLGTCERVAFDDFRLLRAATGLGVAEGRAFALVAGGDGTSRAALSVVDLLRHAVSDLDEDAPFALSGEVRGVALDADAVLLVDSAGRGLRVDLSLAVERATEVSLHVGAARGTVVALRDAAGERAGAAVVGGESEGVASRAISWIAPDGSVRVGELAAPRVAPAVSVRAGALWVASGQGAGEPWVERASPEIVSSVLVAGDAEAGASDAALAEPVEGELVLLRSDAGDETRVRRFVGCPESCAAASAPAWTSTAPIRVHEGVFVTADGVVSAGAGGEVTLARAFAASRERPGVLVGWDGALWVFGGSTGDVARDDVERCHAVMEPDEVHLR